MSSDIKELQEDLEVVGLKPIIIDENTDFNSPEFQELGKKLIKAKHQEEESEPDYEDNLSDVEADSQTLASAGFGTDEDYGYYGGDE